MISVLLKLAVAPASLDADSNANEHSPVVFITGSGFLGTPLKASFDATALDEKTLTEAGWVLIGTRTTESGKEYRIAVDPSFDNLADFLLLNRIFGVAAKYRGSKSIEIESALLDQVSLNCLKSKYSGNHGFAELISQRKGAFSLSPSYEITFDTPDGIQTLKDTPRPDISKSIGTPTIPTGEDGKRPPLSPLDSQIGLSIEVWSHPRLHTIAYAEIIQSALPEYQKYISSQRDSYEKLSAELIANFDEASYQLLDKMREGKVNLKDASAPVKQAFARMLGDRLRTNLDDVPAFIAASSIAKYTVKLSVSVRIDGQSIPMVYTIGLTPPRGN